MIHTFSAKGEHLYEILDLKKTCTQDDIKKQYRKVSICDCASITVTIVIKYLIKYS